MPEHMLTGTSVRSRQDPETKCQLGRSISTTTGPDRHRTLTMRSRPCGMFSLTSFTVQSSTVVSQVAESREPVVGCDVARRLTYAKHTLGALLRHGFGWGGKNKNKCRCPVVSLGQFHCRSDNQLDGTRPCLTESTVRYCRQRWVVFRLLFAAPQSSTPTPVQSLSLSLSVSVHDSMLQNLNRRATRAADGWKVCTSQAGGLSHSTTMKCFADHTHAGRVVWFYCSMRAPAATRGWMGHEAASILDTHTHTQTYTHMHMRTHRRVRCCSVYREYQIP